LKHRFVALVAMGAATAAAACSCPETNILVDDFEGCGATCGWTVSSSMGTAEIVSTILPGEHGLELPGGSTATKSISPANVTSDDSLSLVGDCPNGISATIEYNASGGPASALSVMLAIDDSLDTNGNPPDYTGATYVPLVGAISLPNGLTAATVHEVSLSPAAGGTCTVDLVQFTEAEPCD
jgi:hypothetical protein